MVAALRKQRDVDRVERLFTYVFCLLALWIVAIGLGFALFFGGFTKDWYWALAFLFVAYIGGEQFVHYRNELRQMNAQMKRKIVWLRGY